MGGTREVTAAQLVAEHAAGLCPPSAADADRRPLVVCGTTVATVGSDPSRVTPLCATSARDLPVVEVLAALASQRPTGVLVLETADGTRGFAFEIDQGRVTGARGRGDLERLESWLTEVYRRMPERAAETEVPEGAAGWVGLARDFVQERVLEHLAIAREPGARMTFVRGDVEWLGARLPAEYGMGLDHLLLEHARRHDEMPKLQAFVGPLHRIARPLSEPGPEPGLAEAAGGTGLDFFGDPDQAALSEWRDAILVWRLCDGTRTLREIVEASLLGTFRGLGALVMLARCGHVEIVTPRPEPAASPPPRPTRSVDTQYVYVRPKKPQIERVATRRGAMIIAPGAEPRRPKRRAPARRKPDDD